MRDESFNHRAKGGGSLFGGSVRGGAEKVMRRRDVALGKLFYFLEFWNENRRK